MTKQSLPAPNERHDHFVQKYMQTNKEKRSQEIKSQAGRKPLPESERRERNVLKTYVSDTELEAVRAYVGTRSTSDVLRSLILDAAAK